MHSAPYFTAFGLLTILYSSRVIRLRWQHRVSLGHGGHSDLERAMRVFGNFTEYVPMGLILLIGLEFVQSPPWYVHLCGATLLIGRGLHALALGSDTAPKIWRKAGMILTFVSLFFSSVGVTIWSLMGTPV